jgi:integrase
MPLKVTTRPESSMLWITGTVRGQRIRESAGTDNLALAEEKRAAREAELYRGALHGVKPSRSFGEAALSYLKRDRSEDTKRRMNRFLGFLKETHRQSLGCDQVDQNLLDEAAEALIRPGSADATRMREVVTPVRAVLRHAAIRGWCTLPVFETIRQGRRRKEWLSPEEAEAIIAASPAHLAPMFTFMFCVGPRRGETVGLDWKICPGEVRPGHAARGQGGARRRQGQDRRPGAAGHRDARQAA